MATVAQVLLSAARRLHADAWNGAATGGSTTTLADTACPEPGGWFTGGTIFFLSGANAGRSRVITGWSDITKTFTFAALPDAVQAGDLYAATDVRYPRAALVAALNAALTEIGRVEVIDETTTGVADELEYNLPSGVTDVRRVSIAGKVNLNWQVNAGVLEFDDGFGPAEDDVIRIYHVAPHADVSADSDIISPTIPPDRAIWTTVYYAALARTQRVGDDDQAAAQLVKEADQKRMEARVKFPIRLRPRDPHLGRY